MEPGEKAGDAVSNDVAPKRKETWLSSLAIADYPGLEGEVSVDLSPRCTVFVGRNGAGKSLLLDAIESLSSVPYWTGERTIPGRAQYIISGLDGPDLRYEYSRPRPARKTLAARSKGSASGLIESLWERSGEGWKSLGRYESGRAKLNNGPETLAVGGLLRHANDLGSREASIILESLISIFRIRSGVPREERERAEIFHRLKLMDGPPEIDDEAREHYSRLQDLSYYLTLWGLDPDQGVFTHVREGAARTGVAASMRVSTYEPRRSQKGKQTAGVCELLIDGLNIGLLSDGTLRVLETLLPLGNQNQDRYLILLEEPETGIHPGLLARLLREIESYEGQVIISTHSPQVVSWAKPEQIRLVERQDGKTTVRSLTPSEIDRVHEYLSHDGTLGEFVYGGALDAEE